MRWTDTQEYGAFGRESRNRACIIKPKFRCALARCGTSPLRRPISLMAAILCGSSKRYAHRARIYNADALWFHSCSPLRSGLTFYHQKPILARMPHGRHTETITLLGLLTALTPLSVDMYLPALPALGLAFSAEPGHVQLSLASFFLGLAIGQAFYGPLSDRFGRRLLLYTGLFLFVLASAGCALARSIDLLIALRFFQALGACSSQVIARAVVRDLFEAHEAVRVFSLLVLVMGVGPVLAPLLGGQILTWLGWRAIFWLHTILGSIGLAAAILRLPETHRARPTAPLKLRSVLRGYYQLLADRYFIGYALTGGLGMAGMFAYIVGSPFVFIELFHVRPDRFGFFFGANALGLIAASQVNIRLTRRFNGDLVIGRVLTIQTAACLLLTAATIGRTPGLYPTAG